ncbi:hypothetical protein HBI56_199090 [Parastagonospora nodorum]|nr:hypothetical protein HBH56_204080 [Parastagonospora nodorum]KAH3923929.1 hypothetical protein HBH54_202960 [Parastagonospora nodorum]KAH3941442.1 hypothetical protein HBH53_201370 [Parastagonospora nodorum]KAH3963976.1 hypothetical protein HBH52_214470 [Parastagonospora nodorum]KAH3992871.1 hypothetical protein HBI10_209880 [Parastagonospora nodorum]
MNICPPQSNHTFATCDRGVGRMDSEIWLRDNSGAKAFGVGRRRCEYWAPAQTQRLEAVPEQILRLGKASTRRSIIHQLCTLLHC